VSDLEKKLLGRLLEPADIAEVWDCGVRAEHFENPLLQAVFNFTVDYWQSSQMRSVPTRWVLEQEFSGYHPPTGVTEEVFELASLLRRRYVTNQLQEMLRKAAVDSHVDPLSALKELHAAAYAATETVTPRLTRVNMADTAEQRKEGYLHTGPHAAQIGVPYGIDLLDSYTGGIYPGELSVVGAFAKTGKTWFLCNAAVAALRAGFRPVIFTLEVSFADIQQRIDALYSGVGYNHITRNTLTEEQRRQLCEAVDDLASRGGIAIERPDPGDRTVSHIVTRTRQLAGDYLIIDQLSRLESGIATRSTKELRAAVMSQLSTEISRSDSKIPCLMAVQQRRGDEEPTLESFADAAEIEREVDMALGIYRNAELRHAQQMRCSILGSRRSDATAFLLDWQLTGVTRIVGRSESVL